MPWRARDVRPLLLRRGVSRPQLKRRSVRQLTDRQSQGRKPFTPMSGVPAPDPQRPSPSHRLVLPPLIRIIAITQVWGAATGTWPVVRQLAQWGPDTPIATALLLSGLLLFYTFLGTSALFVLRNRDSAIFWLAAAQLPQLILLQIPDFLYRVLPGAYLVLRAGGSGLGIDVGITSTVSIRWGDLGLSTAMGVNVVAAATLWYLAVVYPSRGSEGRRFPTRAADQLGPRGDSHS